jgi:hypothetical protein
LTRIPKFQAKYARYAVFRIPPCGSPPDPSIVEGFEIVTTDPVHLVYTVGCDRELLARSVAFVQFYGIPVVFETRDPALNADAFVSDLVGLMTAAYRFFPGVVDMLRPEQLDFSVVIDNFSRVGLHLLQMRLLAVMPRYTNRREFKVRLLSAADAAMRFGYSRFVPACKPFPYCCLPVVPGFDPKGYPDIPIIAMLERAREVVDRSEILTHMKLTTTNGVVTVVDIGQVPSTMALMSQLSGIFFYDGQPGSIMGAYLSDNVPSHFMSIKTRDPGSILANALVFATALAISNSIVIPVGMPIEYIVRVIRTAVHRAGDLLRSPGMVLTKLYSGGDWKIILYANEGSREMEAQAAVEMLGVAMAELFAQSSRPQVEYAMDLRTLIEMIKGPGRECKWDSGWKAAAELVLQVVAAFAVVNDFADILELA